VHVSVYMCVCSHDYIFTHTHSDADAKQKPDSVQSGTAYGNVVPPSIFVTVPIVAGMCVCVYVCEHHSAQIKTPSLSHTHPYIGMYLIISFAFYELTPSELSALYATQGHPVSFAQQIYLGLLQLAWFLFRSRLGLCAVAGMAIVLHVLESLWAVGGSG
jgi:hypothetical protein